MEKVSSKFALLLIASTGILLAAAFDRGMAAFRNRDYARAAREFEEAVREQPRNAQYQKMLGETYAAQQTHWKAKDPLRLACELNPREPDACLLLGKSAYLLSMFEPALNAFQTAAALPASRPRALVGMAQSLEALGRTQEAERKYREALAAGHIPAAPDYARFLLREDRGKESVAVLEAAAGKLPEARGELERVKREVSAAPGGGRAAASSPIRFRATPLPRIVSRNGATGAKYLPETTMGGAAVFDFDGDGWPDIFIANGGTLPDARKPDPSYYNRLFRNNHAGGFTDVTTRAGLAGQGYSMGAAAGDYDNDGHPDLFVAGLKSNKLYHNRGDGVFEDVTENSGLGGELGWSIAAGWFDYDNDGRLDLFVVRYLAWDAARDATCGLLSPGVRQYCHPRAYAPKTNLLYHNEGNGRFRNVSAESHIGYHLGKGMSVVFGDIDGDGRLDIFVPNDKLPNFLFRNQGNGKFEEIALKAGVAYNEDGIAVSAMGAEFRDYDNDGREDLFFTALPDEFFSLFRNVGSGQFADLTSHSHLARATRPYAGWAAGMFDFNNDGLKDLFVAGGHVLDNAELNSGHKSRQPNLVFRNEGAGTFAVEALPGDAFHRGAAFGDFNRDGRIDAVVTALNDSPVVLQNVSTGAGQWLALRLIGAASNRDGIGAMVHVTTASGQQWNRVTTSVGYISSSDRVVHFGLGREGMAKSVEIAWPSGIRQRLSNVAGGQYLTVREPAK